MTPAERSERARIGAYSLHAKYDARQTTRRARAAFLARFELQVDPGHKLPEAERMRRAEAARRAYFHGLALKSAAARRGAAPRAD
jgi:hypothetical protein